MRHYLIVDDNRAFGDNLAEIIRDLGDEATAVRSGAEALEAADQQRFDAMVTDMRMPLMGGAELVHRVREVDPGIPALVATAYTGDNDLENARRAGILAVLPKPIPIDRLMGLLRLARRDGLVVLLEDDVALSDNLTEVLRDHGFTAMTAASVTETDQLGPVTPFVAIADIRVPGGADGEAMHRLMARFPKLPVIVTTGYQDALPAVGPRQWVLMKPFDTKSMLQTLDVIYQQGRR